MLPAAEATRLLVGRRAEGQPALTCLAYRCSEWARPAPMQSAFVTAAQQRRVRASVRAGG